MKSGKEKELKEKFIQIGFYIGAVAFSGGALIKLIEEGTPVLLIVNGITIMITVLFTIWSYIHRINVIAYFIGAIFRLTMVSIVSTTSMIALAPVKLQYFSFCPIILVAVLAFISEYRISAKRMSLWEKYKKINIEKGYFNILDTPGINLGNGKSLLWTAWFSPVVVVAARHAFRVMDKDIGRFIAYICCVLLSSIMAMIWAKHIGIMIGVSALQKKHNVIFTTEYRMDKALLKKHLGDESVNR